MKALMKIGSRKISPLHIVRIYKSSRCGRMKWNYDSHRLYHPMIEKMIMKQPMFLRLCSRLNYEIGEYLGYDLYVETTRDYLCLEFKTRRERDEAFDRLIKEWDENIHKFHHNIRSSV